MAPIIAAPWASHNSSRSDSWDVKKKLWFSPILDNIMVRSELLVQIVRTSKQPVNLASTISSVCLHMTSSRSARHPRWETDLPTCQIVRTSWKELWTICPTCLLVRTIWTRSSERSTTLMWVRLRGIPHDRPPETFISTSPSSGGYKVVNHRRSVISQLWPGFTDFLVFRFLSLGLFG